MNDDMQATMQEATRLTRAGRPEDASALIQRLLAGAGSQPRPAERPAGPPHVPQIELRPDAFRSSPEATPQRPGPASRHGDTSGRLRGSLASVLQRLKTGDLALSQPLRSRGVPAPLPEGASFERRTFTCAAGSRPYQLYVPANRPDRPAPLVVMLHGCTQGAEDFAAGTTMNALAEEMGFLVLYPEQTQGANANRCWNWFEPGHQARGAGEPAIIAAMTRDVIAGHGIDPRRVFVAGLSAGAAMAAVMGTTHPDLYAAVGVHSGLAHGSAGDLPSAFAAMRQGGSGSRAGRAGEPVPTIVFHGDADRTVHPRNGEQVIERAAAGLPDRPRVVLEEGRTPAGRGYTRRRARDDEGRVVLEHWVLHGGGHAWSGGSAAGSYTDPGGPDASRAMLTFFLQHRRP